MAAETDGMAEVETTEVMVVIVFTEDSECGCVESSIILIFLFCILENIKVVRSE